MEDICIPDYADNQYKTEVGPGGPGSGLKDSRIFVPPAFPHVFFSLLLRHTENIITKKRFIRAIGTAVKSSGVNRIVKASWSCLYGNADIFFYPDINCFPPVLIAVSFMQCHCKKQQFGSAFKDACSTSNTSLLILDRPPIYPCCNMHRQGISCHISS